MRGKFGKIHQFRTFKITRVSPKTELLSFCVPGLRTLGQGQAKRKENFSRMPYWAFKRKRSAPLRSASLGCAGSHNIACWDIRLYAVSQYLFVICISSFSLVWSLNGQEKWLQLLMTNYGHEKLFSNFEWFQVENSTPKGATINGSKNCQIRLFTAT